jgi:hypothetical protein
MYLVVGWLSGVCPFYSGNCSYSAQEKENAFEIDKNKLKQTPVDTRQDKGDSKRIDPHL